MPDAKRHSILAIADAPRHCFSAPASATLLVFSIIFAIFVCRLPPGTPRAMKPIDNLRFRSLPTARLSDGNGRVCTSFRSPPPPHSWINSCSDRPFGCFLLRILLILWCSPQVGVKNGLTRPGWCLRVFRAAYRRCGHRHRRPAAEEIPDFVGLMPCPPSRRGPSLRQPFRPYPRLRHATA